MKRLLVLAAGILQIPVIKKAHEMGYYVIAADANPSAPGLKYADKAIVANIISEEDMLSIACHEHIDGVIHPCSEVAMNVMGRINDELGLHGISKMTAINATNKAQMRKAFEKNGAPSPKSFCSFEVNEGYRLYRAINGGAILKPSRNSGSRGIAKIEPDMSLTDFKTLYERSMQESREKSVMIEEFIEGPEFSVEIIVWNGQANVLQVTDKKTTGAPYFVELGHSQPSLYSTEIVEKIKDAAVRGVKSLELNNCAAHAEVKIQNGMPYIMEIGARLGGDFISTTLTQISTGIDMTSAAINVALGIEPDLRPSTLPQGVAIRYFTPKPGEIFSIDTAPLKNNPDIFESDIYVKIGDVVNDIHSSLDRSGHVIVISNTVHEAINKAESIVIDINNCIVTK